MLNKTHLFLAIFIVSTLFASCSANDKGVEINGIRWATANVETPGSFAANPESAGGFFSFDEAQTACPPGWRVPTLEEFQSLIDAAAGEWTTVNGVNGRFFGTAPHRIFLPALGFYGNQAHVGVTGWYWSSSHYDSAYYANIGWNLFFNSTMSEMFRRNRAWGLKVRCVKE